MVLQRMLRAAPWRLQADVKLDTKIVKAKIRDVPVVEHGTVKVRWPQAGARGPAWRMGAR